MSFDKEAAEVAGEELAAQAVSRDRDQQAAAYEEIVSLGMDPVELMGEAYRERSYSTSMHDGKIQELERRRREVKRDLDALQKGRPVAAEVVEI